MVCDKFVCERWCVKDGGWQRWCVKDGVWQSGVKDGVWKMVCDKVVCQRWCVWQSCVKVVCVKESVWQSCVWKMVCDKLVCERWCGKRCCVTKLCVTSATPAMQNDARCHKAARLPRKVKVDVTKCQTCHAKWRSMSPSPTPATQDARPCRRVPRLPRKKPWRPRRHLGTKRATSASPAPSVPRLPRKVTVDVTKSHACSRALCSKEDTLLDLCSGGSKYWLYFLKKERGTTSWPEAKRCCHCSKKDNVSTLTRVAILCNAA